MDPKTILAAGLAVLVAAAGGGAALTGAAQPSDDASDVADGPRDVDVTAAYDDATVTVTVTDADGGVENVSVSHDDERVGTTDANGTVTFTTDATDELELTLETGAFEGELEYDLRNGSLTLVEESFEYAELDDADEDGEDGEDEQAASEDDDADEGDDEDDDETGADDEGGDDDEAEADEDDEEDDDEQDGDD